MTVMDAPLVQTDLHEVTAPPSPAPAAPQVPPRPRPRRRPPLSAAAARTAAALFAAAFVLAGVIQPAPDGPAPVAASWLDLVMLGAEVAFLVSLGQLIAGRRTGLQTSLVAGIGLLALTAACPATGHHAIAAWWWVQLGVSAFIALTSLGLLARTRPSDG